MTEKNGKNYKTWMSVFIFVTIWAVLSLFLQASRFGKKIDELEGKMKNNTMMFAPMFTPDGCAITVLRGMKRMKDPDFNTKKNLEFIDRIDK